MAAAALDPLEFVTGWDVEVPADAKVFDVPLTADVYGAAEGVEQLAVLDASGEPQSFFRMSPPREEPSEPRVVLDASPLYAGGAPGVPRVGVTTSERRTEVTVAPGGGGEAAVTAFVLDARATELVPVALELDWRGLPQPFLLEVAVEQSSDLTRWRGIGRGAVAALSIGGAEVRHARVPVRAEPGGYYRITPGGGVAEWHLLRATLVGASPQPAPPQSARVLPLPSSDLPDDPVPDALYFDAGGTLPVAAVSIDFDGGDGWLRAEVAASRSLEGPWTTVAHGELFYELSFQGRDFASVPLRLARHEARYWRLVPALAPRARALALVLSFPQEHLRVATTSAGPYLLAAGTLAEEAGPDATLASVWSSLAPAAGEVPVAALGARRELGGAAALVPQRAFPWRTAALWSALIAGVLVVVVMAVRLAREMGRQPS
jgi:hypothetical protein